MTIFGQKNIRIFFYLIMIFFIVITLIIGGYQQTKLPDELSRGCTLHPTACNILESIGFPAGIINGNLIFTYGILPLIGIFIIVYGFLDLFRIFGKNKWVEGALALVISLSTLPLGLFTIIVSTIFGLLGVYSVAAFGIMFIGGLIFAISGFFEGAESAIKKRMMEKIGYYEDIVRNTERDLKDLSRRYEAGEITESEYLLQKADILREHDEYVKLVSSQKAKLKRLEKRMKEQKNQPK